MTRTRVRHRCEACGATSPKWLGRCPECNEWGSLIAEADAADAPRSAGRPVLPTSVVMPLLEVGSGSASVTPHGSGVTEFDRVLGGGVVAGSVTLLGGEPGI